MTAFVVMTTHVAAEPSEAFSNVGNLIQQRVYPAVFELDGKIAVVGGEVFGIDGWTMAPATMMLYDPDTGDTTYGKPMIYGVELSAYVKGSDGRLYVIGGWNVSHGYTEWLQIYNPGNDTWFRGADAPVVVGGCPAVQGGDGRIYVFGPVGSYYSTLIYNVTSNAWSYGADQPENIWLRHAVAYNDTAIIVMGGRSWAGFATDRVDVYDPVADTWSTVSPLLTATTFSGSALGRNGYVYYFGGSDAGWISWGGQVSSVQRYDVEADEWSYSSSAGVWPARSGFGTAVDDYGRIFLAGGYDGASILDMVSTLVVSDIVLDNLQITSPGDGSIVSGEVAITATLSNPMVGLSFVDFMVDGSVVATQSSSWLIQTWTWVWDTTALPDDSSHTVTVRAYMNDGGIKEDSVTVTVWTTSVEERISLLQDQLDEMESDMDLQAADLDALQAQLDSLKSIVNASDTAIMDQIEALQDQLDALQSDQEDVKASVDSSGLWGMVNLVLLIIVIVLLALMFMMSRKKP